MIIIKTERDFDDSYDSFKVSAVIEQNVDLGKNGKIIVATNGENKNEAVSKAIELIDELIEDIKELKKDFLNI